MVGGLKLMRVSKSWKGVEDGVWGRFIGEVLDRYHILGGGFKYVLCSPLPGEMIQLASIFQMG